MSCETTRPVLLAAGAGSRFSGPTHKLLAPLRGLTVLQWAARAVARADIGKLLIVSGAVPIEVDWLGVDADIVYNPRWSHGQATSLHTAIASMGEAVEAIVVGLGDQPFISSEAWRAVARSDGAIAVATYHGQRANPVRLARQVWSRIPTDGDQGARPLMRMHPELVIEVPCSGDPADIDSLEDLNRWNSSTTSP